MTTTHPAAFLFVFLKPSLRRVSLPAAVLALAFLCSSLLTADEMSMPRLEAVSPDPETGFHIRLHGNPGEYPLEISTNLKSWEPWQSIRVYNRNIGMPVPEIHGADRLFFRALAGEPFETHHLLLSWLALDARPNEAAFRMGLSRMEAVRLNGGSNQLEIFGDNTFWGSVDTPPSLRFNLEQHRDLINVPAAVSSDGMTVEVPAEEHGPEIYPAWEFDFLSMGAADPRDGAPALMAGRALAFGELADGTLIEAQHVLGFSARKRRDATMEELAGEWGLVRMEYLAMDETLRHRVFSLPARVTTDHGGTLTDDGPVVAVGHLQFLSGMAPVRELFGVEEESFAFPVRVNTAGEITLPIHPIGETPPPEGPELEFSGFMSPDAHFMVLSASIPREESQVSPPPPLFDGPLAKHLILGVRRDNNPELTGREYRLLGRQSFAIPGDFEIGSWDEESTIRFDTPSTGSFELADTFHWVPFANAGSQFIEGKSEDMGNIPFVHGVGPGGRIKIDLSGVMEEEEEILLTGYAQEGGRILIFALGTSIVEDGRQIGGEAGLIIAICTNCD